MVVYIKLSVALYYRFSVPRGTFVRVRMVCWFGGRWRKGLFAKIGGRNQIRIKTSTSGGYSLVLLETTVVVILSKGIGALLQL